MCPAVRHRLIIAALVAAACARAATLPAVAQDRSIPATRPQPTDMPIFLQRGMPGPGHARLEPLAGTFRVETSVYMVIGTPTEPAVSTDIMCRREWVAGGRFLHDVTEGTLAGSP
jgi:hypothetical protein